MQEIKFRKDEKKIFSRFCLVNDESGNTYICPVEKEQEFYKALEGCEEDVNELDFLEKVEGEFTFSLPLTEKIGVKDYFPKRFEDEIGKISSSLWGISSIRNQIMKPSEISKTIKEGILYFYHKEIR